MKAIKKILPLLFMIAMAGMVYGVTAGTCEFVLPVTSTIISDSTVINITQANHSIANCTITGTSTLTGDTWTTYTYNDTSGEGHNGTINATATTSDAEDGTDWSLSASCVNDTGDVKETCTVSSLTVDNTIPTAPSALSPTTSDDENNVGTWSATVTAAETTACTLFILTDSVGTLSYTMTHSGSTCTYGTVTLPGHESPLTYYVEASDGTNSTNSSASTVTIDRPGGVYVPGADDGLSESQKNFFGLFIVGVAAYFLFFNKKGGSGRRKRRRKRR